MGGVPVVRVTYSFPWRDVTQEEVVEFKRMVGNVASCTTHPVRCLGTPLAPCLRCHLASGFSLLT